MKLVPVTWMASGAEPASALFGEKPVTVGTTLVTLTLKLAEPPPGDGFDINPLSVPGVAVCAAVNWKTTVPPETVPETPANVAVVLPMKPVPCTVTVAVPEPAGITAGLTVPTAGAGFVWALTVND